MKWYNAPRNWQESAGKLVVQTPANTDAWRITRHDFIADNVPFYAVEVEGDFTATVRVSGAYSALYDQAGMMVRESELTWIKCGIEFMDGVQHASAVITREFSDWSIVPLPDNPATTWFRIQRIGTAVEVAFSHDGVAYTLIRQGYLSAAPKLLVGMMCAAPKGEGFSVTFEEFAITQP